MQPTTMRIWILYLFEQAIVFLRDCDDHSLSKAMYNEFASRALHVCLSEVLGKSVTSKAERKYRASHEVKEGESLYT